MRELLELQFIQTLKFIGTESRKMIKSVWKAEQSDKLPYVIKYLSY